ncbi:unnamed protein product [Peronospora belbahrii]|uniref:Uncharacterized protein n=1 Tax=Peronospora belbahrii TaxID=622444 RepID=A0ABN8CT86_9STRA|nr:unnamed protein product [Peronospora belbahrii]
MLSSIENVEEKMSDGFSIAVIFSLYPREGTRNSLDKSWRSIKHRTCRCPGVSITSTTLPGVTQEVTCYYVCHSTRCDSRSYVSANMCKSHQYCRLERIKEDFAVPSDRTSVLFTDGDGEFIVLLLALTSNTMALLQFLLTAVVNAA